MNRCGCVPLGRPCTWETLPRAGSGCGGSAPSGEAELLTGFRATQSASFLAFDLRDPRLHHFLNKCSRQRFIGGELDGPFGCREALEFALKCFDNRGSREQTAVVRKCGEPHQHSFVLERRHPIADDFGSLRKRSRPNRRANLVQGAAGGFRDASKVFIDAFRSALAFRRGTALARFSPYHAGNSRRTSTSSPCSRLSCGGFDGIELVAA